MALRWQARLSIAAILFMCTEDTLSLNDGMEKLERHPGQGRPRQQMIDHSIGIKTKPEPTFDFNQPTNVTALIGKTAYLTCRVRHLGNKTVSWVRLRDIHILTTGAYTYTIPTATILGGPELYVGAGSTINLTCAIQFSSEPPAYIFWYYDGNVLSYDSPRGGVSVITEKGTDVTTSWLLIQTAQPSDSGEYSCKPSNANTASIRVHVVNGERPEAMQTGTAGPILSSSCLLVSLIILYISSV
ncbi:Protein of unknown function [Cotesia congregata]|uniref:Ig-like domain-containing protein n=1 Tax=Cotesia congregata TaxID=51543 RepID=A0A8J2HIL1_COTCN|nr:Protein of unknown function [Cotesia congregata]